MGSRERLVAAVAATALVVGGGAYAAFGAGSAGGTIRVCANTTTGALRLLHAGQSCRRTESALSWSQRGPAGLPGAAGPPGPTGPPGPKGDQGPAGSLDTSNVFTKSESDSRYVQTSTPGRAIAGVRVDADGTILSWFNALGGEPSVTHTNPSRVYVISFPGFTFDATKIVLATPEPHVGGSFGSEEIVVAPITSGGSAGSEEVTAFDQETGGGTAGEAFDLLVFNGTAGP